MKIATVVGLILLLIISSRQELKAEGFILINGSYYSVSGSYKIVESEGSVILETDKGASWNLDADDLKVFSPGETGHYHFKENSGKPAIITDKQLGFYVDQEFAKNFQTKDDGESASGEIFQSIRGDELSFGAGNFATQEEAIRGYAGQATLERERKKAEEASRKQAEEEARLKAEADAKEREAVMQAIQDAENTALAAKKEAEAANKRLEEMNEKGRFVIDPNWPIYFPPTKEKTNSGFSIDLD